MYKVFIDGKAGTTGLRIYERLADRDDISLITLSEEMRKDTAARAEALNSCDIAFLCLPDQAAVEAVSLIESDSVRVIDTSTAHRTNSEWTYGFPELYKNGKEKIAASKRVCVPGCHAGGFVSLVAPLVSAGILPADSMLCCHSVTGYSGGGKKMIAEYEDDELPMLYNAPRQYALTQMHKHLPEMAAHTGLSRTPVFCPIVSDFYSGMLVTVPLFAQQLSGAGIDDIISIYKNTYNGPVVNYVDSADFTEDGLASACAMSDSDAMQITVAGNSERILLMSRFDNLGKGASGAAVQCMNIMLGLEQTTGLCL